MGSQTKKVLLTPLMRPARPFRVSNHDRSSRRGVTASSLQELLIKVPHQPTWVPEQASARQRVCVLASEGLGKPSDIKGNIAVSLSHKRLRYRDKNLQSSHQLIMWLWFFDRGNMGGSNCRNLVLVIKARDELSLI